MWRWMSLSMMLAGDQWYLSTKSKWRHAIDLSWPCSCILHKCSFPSQYICLVWEMVMHFYGRWILHYHIIHDGHVNLRWSFLLLMQQITSPSQLFFLQNHDIYVAQQLHVHRVVSPPPSITLAISHPSNQMLLIYPPNKKTKFPSTPSTNHKIGYP